jgi:flagellar secretion chaperone FliS
VSANSIAAYLNYNGSTSASGQYSSGSLDAISTPTDPLSGSLSIQVGSGTAETVVIGAAPSSRAANTIYTGSGVNTLAGIAGFITANTGVTASVVTSSSGSSLHLTSKTAGSAGSLAVSSNVLDILRFLYIASAAAERGDQAARRDAVKRALDIIIHLQARLRMDVGGRPAQVLSEFYASVFAQILQASQSASRQKFEHAIECVRNVRDAWRQVARDPDVNPAPVQVLARSGGRRQSGFENDDYGADAGAGSSWNA